MIPKTIHYCWFGHKPLPKSAKKCIASWRKFFPDYEIKEWNEENFDVNIIPYTKQAYEAKKYAFVSDYARLWLLYRFGGVYFDTDVEVIKAFDTIIDNGPFVGVEIPSNGYNTPIINPGLGMGMEPQMPFLDAILETYSSLSFWNEDGLINKKTIVPIITESFVKLGMQPINDVQRVDEVWVYPADFFNPLNSITGKLIITNNTKSIHWYMNSWSDKSRFYLFASKLYHRILGSFNR